MNGKLGVRIRPLGPIARAADVLMEPIMRRFTEPGEASQGTHFWNNATVDVAAISSLNEAYTVTCAGDPHAVQRTCALDVRFHLSKLGGWKKFVVLCPVVHERQWHVGWCGVGFAGVSRIAISGPVRMLIGRKETTFFGIDARDGRTQVPIEKIGEGEIGDGGKHQSVQLL